MADFSEKNPEKLETFAQNNADQIEKLTISAVEEAESSQEDAILIAKVVAVASNQLANKVVEEVSKNSTEENQALSAKVMKSIVETNPKKIETLSDENKETMITQTIEAAKNQNENIDNDDDELADFIADIIVDANPETSGKLIQKLNETKVEENSDLKLSIVEKLTNKNFFEEKLEVIATRSKIYEKEVETFIGNIAKNVEDNKLERIISIIDKSENIIAEKIIKIGKESIENKKKVVKILTKVIKDNPEKAIEIFEKNKKTNELTNTIKTKIDKKDAITVEDFDKVFDRNISPN